MGLLFFFRRNATQVHNWARIASGTAKEKVVEVMQLKDQGVPGVSPASSTMNDFWPYFWGDIFLCFFE